MHFTTLTEWLNWQATLHPRDIDLGLIRCQTVAHALHLLTPTFPVISVAGTNGKGSSVTLLTTILIAAGYRVGSYTSPHLLNYNERITINLTPVSDFEVCQAFAEIEQARNQVTLTYFEFGTLAAMWLFQHHQVDIAVLEVGLGGRLDAVNVFEPTLSLVTAIDIDHTEWLGKDREKIGLEKAGIFRPQRPAVCSDPHPPQSLIQHAHQLQTPLYCLGQDFHYQKLDATCWSWQNIIYPETLLLPLPNLLGEHQLKNAAGVLMIIKLLQQQFKITQTAIEQGLKMVSLLGRFQVIRGEITRIFDVAHNPQGAEILYHSLKQYPCHGQYHAVVGILREKDITGILMPFIGYINHWYLVELNTPRSASVESITTHLKNLGVTHFSCCQSVNGAYQQALQKARPGDCMVIFGSFYTVAEALRLEEGYTDQ